jgi:hypothetical protein
MIMRPFVMMALGFIVVPTQALAACPAGQIEVQLQNRTIWIVDDLYVSAPDEEDWIEVTIGPLEPGASATFCAAPGDWDVYAADAEAAVTLLVRKATLQSGDPLILAE